MPDADEHRRRVDALSQGWAAAAPAAHCWQAGFEYGLALAKLDPVLADNLLVALLPVTVAQLPFESPHRYLNRALVTRYRLLEQLRAELQQ
jgi:hypothetical protein